MRLDLRDDQWADLREHVSHGTSNDIFRARREIRVRRDAGDELAELEWPGTFIAFWLKDWHVVDPETDEPIAGVDRDAILRAPEDIVDHLLVACSDRWWAVKVPNPSTPPSSDGSSSNQIESPTTTSTDSPTPSPSETPGSS